MRTFALLVALVPALVLADVGEFAAKLDALHAQRHDSSKLKEQEQVVTEALQAHPDDYAVLWRAARYKYWLGDGAADKAKREKWGKEAWDLGERAVKANPDGIEGQYYSAIGLGVYSQGVGILTALTQGLEGKFNSRLDKAIQLDAGYDNAGPLIAKGRYFFELPWPKRDLEASQKTLRKAIATQPAALRAYLYLAETELADGEAGKAKETLARVLSGAEGYDKAEARRVKDRAKGVQTQIEEELK